MRVLLEIAPVNLPDTWPLRRIRDIAILLNGFPFKSEDFDTSGDIPLVRIRDLFSHQFEIFVPKLSVPDEALIRDGDIAIGMDGDFNSVVWNRGPAALNQRICVLRPKKGTDHRFLSYVLPPILQVLNDLTYSTTVKHLSSQDVLQQVVPFPPIEIQNQVSSFLDRETMQIDELIAKQERLIDLLAEKRQAIITEAVTKGLTPSAPTKPSGIPWLNEVPEGWRMSRLAWESSAIGDGLHGTPKYSDDGSFPFINGTNLLGGKIRITPSTSFVDEDQLTRADMSLSESTVLMSINGTVGNCATLGRRRVMLSKSAAYINCGADLNPDFLAAYLRSDLCRSYFLSTSGGTTIANLSLATLRATPIPVPGLEEQLEIVQWVADKTAQIHGLLKKTTRAIELLRERRSALISAAVTGKIDVREGAA